MGHHAIFRFPEVLVLGPIFLAEIYKFDLYQCLSSLTVDGVALPQTDPVHNLGVLLDSQLLLKEQLAVLARRAFAQPQVPQLPPLPGP